jgi:hypothetical protein
VQVILALALIAGAFFFWRWLNPPPEKVIRARLEKLAGAISVKAGEGNIARVTAVNRAIGYFAPNVVVSLEGIPGAPDSIQGRTELQQMIMAGRSQLTGDVRFEGIFVQVEPSGTNAWAQFGAVAQVARDKQTYSQNVKAKFAKIEGDWLIVRVDGAPRMQLEPP